MDWQKRSYVISGQNMKIIEYVYIYICIHVYIWVMTYGYVWLMFTTYDANHVDCQNIQTFGDSGCFDNKALVTNDTPRLEREKRERERERAREHCINDDYIVYIYISYI